MEQPVDFKTMVKRLVKPGEAIIETMTPAKANKLHMAVGLAGEVFELMECLKFDANNQAIDEANLIEELGDIEFYLEGLNQIYCPKELANLTTPVHKEQEAVDALHLIHRHAGMVLDFVKKEVIYNKEDPLLHDQIQVSLCYVRYNLNVFYNHRYLAERTKETIAKVQGANMEKLLTGKKARFSEGSYTDEAAKLRRDKDGVE